MIITNRGFLLITFRQVFSFFSLDVIEVRRCFCGILNIVSGKTLEKATVFYQKQPAGFL